VALRSDACSKVPPFFLFRVDWVKLEIRFVGLLQVLNSDWIDERLAENSEIHEGNYSVLSRGQLSVSDTSVSYLYVRVVIKILVAIR